MLVILSVVGAIASAFWAGRSLTYLRCLKEARTIAKREIADAVTVHRESLSKQYYERRKKMEREQELQLDRVSEALAEDYADDLETERQELEEHYRELAIRNGMTQFKLGLELGRLQATNAEGFGSGESVGRN